MSGFLVAGGMVQASPNDGTQGTLLEKLVAGANIEFTLVYPTTDYERLEISGLGSTFTAIAATLGGAAGATAGLVFKSDGLGSGSMVTNTVNIARRLMVSPTGPDADYTSIRSAVLAAIAGGASAASPWEIRVCPGTYTELPITVQAGIVITADLGERADTVNVIASNPNLDLFTVTGGYISGLKVSGVTDPVRCLFRLRTPLTAIGMRGITISNCSTGISVENGAILTAYNLGCSITAAGQSVDTILKVTGSGSNAIILSGFAFVPSFVPALYSVNPIQTGYYADGYSRLQVQQFNYNVAYKNDTACGIKANNAAYVEILSSSFENCNNAIHIDGYYADVIIQGSCFTNNVLNIKNDSSTGIVQGIWSTDVRALSNVVGGKRTGYVQFRDDETSRIFGSTKYNFTETNKDVDLGDFFGDNISTGVCEGGIVTVGTGLTVNISEGDGWIFRAAFEDAFWVEWDAYNSLALTPSATNYIFYDSSLETFKSSASMPGDTGILLATAITGITTVRYLHRTATPNNNTIGRLHNYLMTTRKLALSSGMLCSQGTDTARNISIASGEYYIGLDLISYVGSAAAATFNYYHGANGAVEQTSQTQLNLDSYDFNGALVEMQDGYFRNDTVSITSDGYVAVVLGTAEYQTQALAQVASTANIPTFLEPSAFPVGKVVFKKDIGIIEIMDIRPQPAEQAGASPSGVSVHASLSGLNADDHSQYLPIAGSRAMTGNLQMGSFNITGVGTVDNVDVSTHGSRHNPNAIDAISTAVPTAELVGVAANEGLASSLARSDHQHGIPTGTPIAIGIANVEGASSSVSRLDHVHDHGAQTVGTLHAAVVAGGASGFITGTDKTKLDGLVSRAAPMLWGNDGISTTTTTRYLSPGFSSNTAITTAIPIRMPYACNIRNLYIRHTIGAGNGNAIVYTLLVNGVATALTVSLASTANDGSNLVNTVAVAQGDLLSIRVTKALSIGTSPTNVFATLEAY